MRIKLTPSVFLIVLFVSAMAVAHEPPLNARVFFIGIEDGAVVESSFEVKFGIEGFGITPAGTKSKIRHRAGHYHLLVDMDFLPNQDRPIPRNEHMLHFDAGETETVLVLPPGTHTLQLLLGDEDHEPHSPVLMSKKITIEVQ
jgi:hypothetical protein